MSSDPTTPRGAYVALCRGCNGPLSATRQALGLTVCSGACRRRLHTLPPGRPVLRWASRGQDEPFPAWEWWEDAWGPVPIWDDSASATAPPPNAPSGDER